MSMAVAHSIQLSSYSSALFTASLYFYSISNVLELYISLGSVTVTWLFARLFLYLHLTVIRNGCESGIN